MRRHHGRSSSPYAGRTATPPSAEVILVRSFDSHINSTRPVRQSPLATSQIQGMPLDLINRIRSFPLFQSTPDSFLAEIGLLLKPQTNAPNDYVITEGDDAKAMYWLVRGSVAVTSRDGESTYAELKPGAFFGEIGILMDRPRTATVVARTRCLLLVLKKEDLRKILPRYPKVEQAIREEALERLTILEKKKQGLGSNESSNTKERRGSKRARDATGDEAEPSENEHSIVGTSKRRKSPSPGSNDTSHSSALGHGLVNVRALLKELPLFSALPSEMLHFLGLNAQPHIFPPFTDIIKQNSTGREIYFIVRGEVEVLDERRSPSPKPKRMARNDCVPQAPSVKARLRSGQYFGEVVSLSLAPRRTATVRSISQVECLMISETVLKEFWDISPPNVRQQVEETAKERLQSASENDVVMKDVDSAPDLDDLIIGETPANRASKVIQVPHVTFENAQNSSPQSPGKTDEPLAFEPSDPDPFSDAGLEKVRSRSRRSSFAPPPPDELQDPQKRRRASRASPTGTSSLSPRSSQSSTPSPMSDYKGSAFPFTDPFFPPNLPRPKHRSSLGRNRGNMPDNLLVLIFQQLELHELIRIQAVSLHWHNVLTKSDDLLHTLDLSRYNRKVTDGILAKSICPFVRARPRLIDISNCFHITDEGFTQLVTTCGANVKIWRMKSVWDVTAPAILEMANKARGLEAIDLSNCRKVSDTLLARIIGWVVPAQPPGFSHGKNRSNALRPALKTSLSSSSANTGSTTPIGPAPGTVFGCPNLSTISLSYCKHITDRTMHHIANHAASRVECMDLTRCTTITDTGFQYWGNARFEKLRKLCLADCTYLSDQSVVWLVNGAGNGLRELDLVSYRILFEW